MTIKKIVSGGQTGVDQGALDFALSNRITCGGWCPKGRISEAGKIPPKYPVKEIASRSYCERTALNVMDSDGTLLLQRGDFIGKGTKYTIECCKKFEKTYFIMNTSDDYEQRKIEFAHWLVTNNIRTLNVAGGRESQNEGIQKLTFNILKTLFQFTTD